MLAGLVASWLLPIIGWRYLFLVGLSPLVLVFMIRYWVPESPRWLIRMGRHEEARKSLAWALMIDPNEIALPATLPAPDRTRWLELFKYPRLVAAGCLTGLTQTGGASLGLWGATLLVIVLNTTPAHAAFLMVWVGLSGIVGRFFVTALIEPVGRRGAGTLVCGMAADNVRGLSLRRLYRRLVAVLHVAGSGNLFQQCDLHCRRTVYVRNLAGPAAQQRHGHELWRRQSRRQGSAAGSALSSRHCYRVAACWPAWWPRGCCRSSAGATCSWWACRRSCWCS
jgi:MFS family permease